MNTVLVRNKLGKDQNAPHKLLQWVSKAIETVPMTGPVQPPLQLIRAGMAVIEEKLLPTGELEAWFLAGDYPEANLCHHRPIVLDAR